tara:strand:- start:1142 stop:2440 length:1299 start_codon:yes stop_codon:yes gene_type:complete
MKKIIGVYGTTHLALVVSAAFLKKKYKVILFEKNLSSLKNIEDGKLPIYEPFVPKILENAKKNKQLTFAYDHKKNLKKISLLYFAEDSVKTKEGIDLDKLVKNIKFITSNKKEKFTMIISSQVPVGTTVNLSNKINLIRKEKIDFVYIPEFLRLGNAFELYLKQDYIIIGNDNTKVFVAISNILKIFSKNIFPMGLSDAEFSKHFANIFVASSVSLVSQFSQIADHMGVNLKKVGLALRHDKRIGQKSYILPGLGFTGGNIERDLKVVSKLVLTKTKKKPILLDSILKINELHNQIPVNLIVNKFKNIQNKKISFLGVTYKENTDTLKGSLALEYAKKLQKLGAIIKMYDANLQAKSKFGNIKICKTLNDCIKGSDILIIVIAKKEYKNLSPKLCSKLMRSNYIIDAANMLNAEDFKIAGFNYSGIGTGYKF